MFVAWCAVQSDRIDRDLTVRYFNFQRRVFQAEWEAERARMWARLVSQIGPGILRDIRENRVEA